MKGRKVALLLIIVMLVFTMSTVFAISFSDLPEEHWAYENIMTLANKKVINGYTDGTFRPSGTITRGEFIKLVVSSTFTRGLLNEVEKRNAEYWAIPYVELAEKTYILNPYEYTLEQIKEPITRIEMVRIISRADLYKRKAELMSGNLSFVDIEEINEEDKMYLTHSVKKGYLTGYTDGTFRVSANMNRAEAATVILRYRTIK